MYVCISGKFGINNKNKTNGPFLKPLHEFHMLHGAGIIWNIYLDSPPKCLKCRYIFPYMEHLGLVSLVCSEYS